MNEISKLKEQIKRLEKKEHHKHHKKSTANESLGYSTVKKAEFGEAEIQSRISHLEASKPKEGGFRNMLRRGAINTKINQERKILAGIHRERLLDVQTHGLKREEEYLKAKQKVAELKKSVNIDFTNLGGQSNKKQLKFEDLF